LVTSLLSLSTVLAVRVGDGSAEILASLSQGLAIGQILVQVGVHEHLIGALRLVSFALLDLVEELGTRVVLNHLRDSLLVILRLFVEEPLEPVILHGFFPEDFLNRQGSCTRLVAATTATLRALAIFGNICKSYLRDETEKLLQLLSIESLHIVKFRVLSDRDKFAKSLIVFLVHFFHK